MVAMTWLKGVFWDVDGTLANTEMEGHRPAFNRAFADLGLAINWEPELYADLSTVSPILITFVCAIRFAVRRRGRQSTSSWAP